MTPRDLNHAIVNVTQPPPDDTVATPHAAPQASSCWSPCDAVRRCILAGIGSDPWRCLWCGLVSQRADDIWVSDRVRDDVIGLLRAAPGQRRPHRRERERAPRSRNRTPIGMRRNFRSPSRRTTYLSISGDFGRSSTPRLSDVSTHSAARSLRGRNVAAQTRTSAGGPTHSALIHRGVWPR